MKKNIGITDRIIRFVAMDLLLGISFLGIEIPPIYGTWAFIISVLLIWSIVTGYSLVYRMFGLSTVEEKAIA